MRLSHRPLFLVLLLISALAAFAAAADITLEGEPASRFPLPTVGRHHVGLPASLSRAGHESRPATKGAYPLGSPDELLSVASLGEQLVKDLVKEVFPIPAVTGNENLLSARIASLLPKTVTSQTDNLGSLYARVGIGGPAVLAGLDEFGYVVSGISADGFLRLDRATPLPVAIYDSFLIGHPVIIAARKGIVDGIVAQPAIHLLSRERREQWAKDLTLDLVFVDIGVRSESEARAKGIEILDPVTFRSELSVLAGDRWAGPALGQKAVCAALVASARALANDAQAGADLVWMAQTRFPARGISGSVGAARARARLGARPALILDAVSADRGENSPVFGKGLVLIQAKEGPSKLREAMDAIAADKKITLQYRTGGNSLLLAPFLAEGGDALILALPTRYAGTPAEIIDLKDVQAMADLVAGLGQIGRLR